MKRFLNLTICVLVMGVMGCGDAPLTADLSSPQSVFASYKAAVEAWDLKLMYRCMHDSHMAYVSYEDYAKMITPRKAEIQACIAAVEMGGRVLDQGDYMVFDMNGCESRPDWELGFAKDSIGWAIRPF